MTVVTIMCGGGRQATQETGEHPRATSLYGWRVRLMHEYLRYTYLLLGNPTLPRSRFSRTCRTINHLKQCITNYMFRVELHHLLAGTDIVNERMKYFNQHNVCRQVCISSQCNSCFLMNSVCIQVSFIDFTITEPTFV